MPILDANTLEIFSHSPEQTRRIGMRLGSLLQPGDLVCLEGELGSGKTTLVQGVAQGWGSLDDVSSPTFVLVNIYRKQGDARLFHLDSYRIDSPAEATELDLDNMLLQGALLIEWPERMSVILPDEHLWINLAYLDEEQRSMSFKSQGSRYKQLLTELRTSVYGVV